MPITPLHPFRRLRPAGPLIPALVAGLALSTSPAGAATGDVDNDGMNDAWETRHGLTVGVNDAAGDKDGDGLRNRGEFRYRTLPGVEDTDRDGMDDGDEVADGAATTNVSDRDTDDDTVPDGDEDTDRDGTGNEDEDDRAETCPTDDDDADGDYVADEDENELRLRLRDSDSDDDGTTDGAEDRDRDGESNEDEDDSEDDSCQADSDDDGVEDEDEGDLLGVIVSFDAATGALTIETTAGGLLNLTVTEDTEIDIQHTGNDGSTADLVPGAPVAEVDIDEGLLEEVELWTPEDDGSDDSDDTDNV